jgi:calcineurin-like phosphoesterase family protein
MEMDNTLMRNWNNTVTSRDIVFNLGDFVWKAGRGYIPSLQEHLAGTIYNIQGNHDKEAYFGSTDYYDIINLTVTMADKRYKFVLSHYPLMTWAGRDRGVINLHGHIHTIKGQRSDHEDHNLPYHSNQYDVGVDNNDYTPIELREILKIINYGMGNNF